MNFFIRLSINDKSNLPGLLSVVFHEIIHLIGARKFQVNEQGDRRMITSGFTQRSVLAREDRHVHFRAVEEGVVAELEKRHFSTMMADERLEKYRERRSNEEKIKIREQIISSSPNFKKFMIVDDILWVGDNMEHRDGVGYFRERRILSYIYQEIAEQVGVSSDGIFDEFVKAQLIGNFLPVARLMKQTFGEDAFRLLSLLDPKQRDDNSQFQIVLETLQKMRRRQLGIIKKQVDEK